MDEKLLVSFGLSQNQARAYRALVLKKSLRPGQLAKLTGESRTNCYALLNRLVEMGLATKVDEAKKYIYYPASPLALKSMLDKDRQALDNQLQELDRRLPQMLSQYHAGGQQPKVRHYKGEKELRSMYDEQMEQTDRELYFVRSKADIPYFGLTQMEEVRQLARKYKKRRFGITPMLSNAPTNRRSDAATNLKRAWIKPEDYDAAVEWAVSGDQLQAILLKNEGYGISIEHPEIADSFRQILKLLYAYIHKDPDYKQSPKNQVSELD
jgi:sugar-specific transcriptional regulator TrmB